MPRSLLGAGFNAHGQVDSRNDNDCYSFQQLFAQTLDISPDASIPFAGWSEIALSFKDSFLTIGNVTAQLQCLEPITCAFGDHNGVAGVLDEQGTVRILEQSGETDSVRECFVVSDKRFKHVVIAGNGSIAAVPMNSSATVLEFESLSAFYGYLARDSTGKENLLNERSGTDENRKGPHPASDTNHKRHTIEGNVEQLVANTANFCALDDRGRVYTWGDNRYGTLGREGPADIPQLVDHLGDFESEDEPRITKVVAGGWMMGAVRADGVAWVWGTQMPGTDHRGGLLDGDGGYVDMVVEIEDKASGVLDVLDMALGDGFVVVVCEGGRLFGLGENGNGQFGEGRKRMYHESWVELTELDTVNVWASPKTVYVRANGNYG